MPRRDEQRRRLLDETVPGTEGAPDEHGERQPQPRCRRGEDSPDREPLAADRAPADMLLVGEVADAVDPAFEAARDRQDEPDGDELQERQRRRGPKVEGAGRLIVDRGLERRACRPAQDQHDAE